MDCPEGQETERERERLKKKEEKNASQPLTHFTPPPPPQPSSHHSSPICFCVSPSERTLDVTMQHSSTDDIQLDEALQSTTGHITFTYRLHRARIPGNVFAESREVLAVPVQIIIRLQLCCATSQNSRLLNPVSKKCPAGCVRQTEKQKYANCTCSHSTENKAARKHFMFLIDFFFLNSPRRLCESTRPVRSF